MRRARKVAGRGVGGIPGVVCAALLACAAATAAAGPAEDAAREHTKHATAAYNLGHYDEAAAEFEAAYRQVLDPMLLFNIGQAYRLAGRSDKALTAYKAYLRTAPPNADRTQAERWKAELERKLATLPAPAPEPAPPPPAPSPTAAPSTAVTTPPRAAPPATAPVSVLSTPGPAPAPPEAPRPLYTRWWLWTAVGAVAAAGVATALVLGRDRRNPDCLGIQPCGSF